MTNFQSLVFYLTIFSCSCIFAGLAQYAKKHKTCPPQYLKRRVGYCTFMMLSMMFPIITAGIRYNVGVDFNSYVDIYYNIVKSNFLQNIKTGEFGYLLLNKASEYIFNGPQGVFLFSSIITIGFLYAALHDHEDKIAFPLALFLYFTKIYPFSLNVMRQSIAISIILYSYKYIVSKNFKKFLLFVIIAALFHTSAIVVIPFYFISGEKRKKRLFLKVMSALSCIFVVINVDVILEKFAKINVVSKYSVYADTVNNNHISISSLLSQIIILVLVGIFWKKLIKKDQRVELYIWLYIFGFILALAETKIQYAGRIGMYFNILAIILIPYLLSIIKNKVIRNCFNIAIIVYGSALFIFGNYFNNVHLIMPFKFFWNQLGI
jgi:transmembrane protein EpsG